ncbi:peptidase M14 [Comamonas piscis]|uniref:Peptidase M14 n=1 Tax=Comamonas piscis TaxID=1562974 RepID=A0A7G5EI17_9BURK|nr:peptidase M14 [Comamonas piscis]QMV73642.1 peptidase M14 [Comamonas piscis]WSO32065.1 peptidase M14 [Comamonas piscis]
MTLLLSSTIDRTLTHWVAERLAQPQPDLLWQLWCFEGLAARRAAEQQLAQLGVRARIHSAYKPLVHAVLEDLDTAGLQSLHLHYPLHADAAPNRFMLEAYPLAAMLPPGAALQMQAGQHNSTYDLQLHYQDGRSHKLRVFAPNRAFQSAHGGSGITPCGWQQAHNDEGELVHDAALLSDYEAAYAQAMQAIAQHAWPQTEPFFGRLHIAMQLPGFEQAIAATGETMSTPEAMHEDLYFSLLEHFQKLSGRAAGDRRLQPGQIVPDIRMAAQSQPLELQVIDLQIRALPLSEPLPEGHDRLPPAAFSPNNIADADTNAAQLQRAPSLDQMHALVQPLFDAYGIACSSQSVQGRSIAATYKKGSQHPVVLSGGQHANEISGVTGALRGALALAQQADSHFAYIPIENPDGYDLHQWYCRYAPEQMHHATRYTALGDDLAYRDHAPWWEGAVRRDAVAASAAQLHLSLHGYPAHEWTRPLSGYVPQGFDLWTIPKGFFLILRYHEDWQPQAEALAEQVALALLRVEGLPEYNRRQLALYQSHSGRQPFALRHGTPCTMQVDNDGLTPVSLITEFPDQTVVGDALVFAHTVQRAAVLAAYAAWQDIVQTR